MNLFETRLAMLGTPDCNVVIDFKTYFIGERISVSNTTIVVKTRMNVHTIDLYNKSNEHEIVANILKCGKPTPNDSVSVAAVRKFLKENSVVAMSTGGF